MSKNNLFKEVIENGSKTKKVLEKEVQRGLLEMLSPQITSLVQKRLSETEDEYESDEVDEANIADLMQNVEENSDETDDLGVDAGMDATEGDATDDIASMSKDELKDFITNAVKEALGGEAEEVDSTGIEGDDEIPSELEGEEGQEGEEEEDELDEIDALIAEMSSMDAKEDESETEKTLNEEIKSLKKEISTLRKDNLDKQKKLNESTLLIAQVVYANKLIAEHKLNQTQIVKFATILEGTKSESELKRVYEAICESIQTIGVKTEIKNPKVVKESWKINQSIEKPKQSLNESVDPSFARMKYNAGLL